MIHLESPPYCLQFSFSRNCALMSLCVDKFSLRENPYSSSTPKRAHFHRRLRDLGFFLIFFNFSIFPSLRQKTCSHQVQLFSFFRSLAFMVFSQYAIKLESNETCKTVLVFLLSSPSGSNLKYNIVPSIIFPCGFPQLSLVSTRDSF